VLLRTKLHFGLLHLLSVFLGPASTLQQFTFTEGYMLNGDADKHEVRGAPLSLHVGDDEMFRRDRIFFLFGVFLASRSMSAIGTICHLSLA
jgi:hypothetical protein